MFLEWTDPPFAPGHWIPEMIEIAGGDPVLATPGEKSRRVTWEQVHAAEPEVVVVAPCGFDRDGSQRLADELVASGVLPAGVPAYAVDANASWARPGTRLPDGIEELARLLHHSRAGTSRRQ
jgi:iron complex transport system substrate-binding protein